MLLTIDCGNTNLVFAIHDGENWLVQWRISSHAQRTADEYMAWLLPLMQWQDIPISAIQDVVISTVVPQSLFNLRNLSRRYFNCEPLVVGEQLQPTLSIALETPKEIGADRLVNAVAAHAEYKGNLLIIDSGTAITFDYVSEKGVFEGGVICPGIALSMAALQSAAAKLPKVEIKKTTSFLGRSTQKAMQSGIFWGHVAMIEGFIEYLEQEAGHPLSVIATGGIIPLFSQTIQKIHYFDADLTIKGLLLLYRQYNINKSNTDSVEGSRHGTE